MPRTITIDAQIKCVEREIKRRRHYFPKLVADGKLSEDGATAEIAVMQAVLETLTQLRGIVATDEA